MGSDARHVTNMKTKRDWTVFSLVPALLAATIGHAADATPPALAEPPRYTFSWPLDGTTLKPAANPPGEVFNIKSAAISSGRTLGEAQSMHLASCPTASANRDAHQPLSPFRVKFSPCRRSARMSGLPESGPSLRHDSK